jgi:Rieske Fe-S protein
MADPDRRRFLSITTCAIGGGVGVAVLAPVLRLVVDPTGKKTVIAPTEPLVVGSLDRFAIGAPPKRVELVAPVVQDAWTSARDVVLGSAWVRRTAPDKVEALSGVCPHGGCVFDWDAAASNFFCGCHESRFAANGDFISGKSPRGLDPLDVDPVALANGKLALRWVRYKLGTAKREPA